MSATASARETSLALGGFAGAILLAVFAPPMAVHRVEQTIHPVVISFHQAIFAAVLGLVVDGACALIANHRHAQGKQSVVRGFFTYHAGPDNREAVKTCRNRSQPGGRFSLIPGGQVHVFGQPVSARSS